MLDALGNIGDFLGGIGVVATLFYLAFQIRQNSQAVATNAGHSVLASMSETLRSMAMSKEMSTLVVRGMRDQELDDDELLQFGNWVFAWFRIIEKGYEHYQLGNISFEQWEGNEVHLKMVLPS